MNHGCIGVMLLLAATGASAQDVPIVQPGAPGQKTTRLTAEQAVKLADARYTVVDVTFMRDMVYHHDQAVQMAELVKDRTNLPELVAVAGRINASQADEIAFMQKWLRDRGESVPDASMHRGMDMKGTMAGMASPADMARLATRATLLAACPASRKPALRPTRGSVARVPRSAVIRSISAFCPVFTSLVNWNSTGS